jgi:hypothetical protein
MTTRRPTPNTTAAGAVACAFGTPWLDHFEPPIGTARGCSSCDSLGFTVDAGVLDNVAVDGFWSQTFAELKRERIHQATQDRLFDLDKGDA